MSENSVSEHAMRCEKCDKEFFTNQKIHCDWPKCLTFVYRNFCNRCNDDISFPCDNMTSSIHHHYSTPITICREHFDYIYPICTVCSFHNYNKCPCEYLFDSAIPIEYKMKCVLGIHNKCRTMLINYFSYLFNQWGIEGIKKYV